MRTLADQVSFLKPHERAEYDALTRTIAEMAKLLTIHRKRRRALLQVGRDRLDGARIIAARRRAA